MPLLLQVDELQAGMQLYESITSGGRVLLMGGRFLTAADIDALRRRLPAITVRVVDPILDEVIEFQDDSHERAVAVNVQQQIAQGLTSVQDRFAQTATLRTADLGGLQAMVRSLTEYLQCNPVSAALVARCMEGEDYLATHAGNVFYLSMLLATRSLDYVVSERKRQTRARDIKPEHMLDLVPLGLGALIMDFGLLSVRKVLESPGRLTEEQVETFRSHPQVGYDALPETVSSLIRTVVKMHHENVAGTGYPAGLPGDRVHVFARIVRIADAFDAATSDRVYKGARSAVRVLWEMTEGPTRHYYDRHLTEKLGNLIQPFPIGARVRIQDGRYAVVVRHEKRNPFSPMVVVAFDALNRPIPRAQLGPPLRLGSSNSIRAATYNEEDVSYIYTHHEEAAVRVEPNSFKTALDAMYP